jgi:hypothetical protein
MEKRRFEITGERRDRIHKERRRSTEFSLLLLLL